MGQKVNPISLRLEKTNRHFDSCWYSDYNYTSLVLQDLKIKRYLKNVLNQIQYPEGRVMIENLPNKSNINLFYCNPSLSRQKKKYTFQLQTLNRLKSVKKSHPTQKYWKDFFTFAQQTLEGWKSTVCAFPLQDTNTQNLQKKIQSFSKKQKNYTIGTNKVAIEKQTRTQYPKADHNQRLKNNSTKHKNIINKGIVSRNTIPYTHTDIFEKKIQFIYQETSNINSGKKNQYRNYTGFEKRVFPSIDPTIPKWIRERFFTRYLLAQLYGKFLQNKKLYSQETLHTLYQWLIFFQERNRFVVSPNPLHTLLHTQNIHKKDPTNKAHTDHRLYTEQGTLYSKNYYTRRFVDSKYEKVTYSKPRKIFCKEINKEKGLYSSNRVYNRDLESFLCKQYPSFFNLFFFRIQTEKQGALFLVEDIIYYLERKIPFRRIKSQILKEIPRYRSIRGIRITCSGRVGGRSKKAQRSKTQSLKIGQTPLGVFSSKIDFASKSALTRFGLVGVKVWVCYI